MMQMNHTRHTTEPAILFYKPQNKPQNNYKEKLECDLKILQSGFVITDIWTKIQTSIGSLVS